MAAAQEFIIPAADSCERTDLALFNKRVFHYITRIQSYFGGKNCVLQIC